MLRKRTLNLFLVTLILFASFAFRIHKIAEVPGGFSEEELIGIRVIENIRQGTIFVFFDTGNGRSVESLYYALSVTVTRNTGDGLLGYRIFSVWLGLLTLALLYAVARRLFGRRVGLLALVMMGGGLVPNLLSRTATHQVMMPLLTLLVMWSVTQAFHLRQRLYIHAPTTLSYTLLGVSVSLIAYGHPTGFLAGLAVLIFAIRLGQTNPHLSRDVWWNSGYALLMALILSIPYLVSVLRNLQISGPYVVFWQQRPTSILALLESIGGNLLAFFWQGDVNPAHNVPGLPLIHWLEPVFLVVGLMTAYQRRTQINYFLVLSFFGIGLIPDMWVNGGADFRWFMLLLPSVYILIGIGIVRTIAIARQQITYPERLAWAQKARLLPRLTLLLIVAGIGADLGRSYQYLIEEWPSREDTRFAYNAALGEVALYLDKQNDATPTLICTKNFAEASLNDFQASVSDIQILEWMLHREELLYRVANCRTDLVFIDGGAPMQIIFTDATDLNVLSTPLLPWFRLATPDQNQLTQTGEATRLWRLEATQQIQAELARFPTYANVYYPRDLAGTLEVAPLPLDFDGNLSLMGIEPLPRQPFFRPGDVIQLTSYWHVDDFLAQDIGVFVRLHDIPEASPYTEVNSFAVSAKHVRPGDVIVQVAFLTLPAQLRPHQYLLTLGVYEGLPVNQRRVYDPENFIPRGTYVLVDQPFRVQTP